MTLLALDDARAWMEQNGAEAVARLKAAAARFHARAAALGYADGQDEPGWAYDRTRVVLRAPQGGYALSEALAARGVDVEMSDADRVVCILLSLIHISTETERCASSSHRRTPRPGGVNFTALSTAIMSIWRRRE